WAIRIVCVIKELASDRLSVSHPSLAVITTNILGASTSYPCIRCCFATQAICEQVTAIPEPTGVCSAAWVFNRDLLIVTPTSRVRVGVLRVATTPTFLCFRTNLRCEARVDSLRSTMIVNSLIDNFTRLHVIFDYSFAIVSEELVALCRCALNEPESADGRKSLTTSVIGESTLDPKARAAAIAT